MHKNDFAPTAPMGWNSYDYYNTAVTEEQIKANARYMAEHLKEYGWKYIVIDIEWYSKDAGTKPGVQYIPFGDDEIDEFGRFQPAPNRFPSSADGTGFTKLAEYIHGLGLKFGIHIMRGIPRTAAERHLPVTGDGMSANPTPAGFTAADIADPNSICIWNPDMYGLKNTREAQMYYDGLIQMYADWGVDFIKCDDICDSRLYKGVAREDRPLGSMGKALGDDGELFAGWAETEMLHKAIMKTGREIVLSLSPGPAHIDRAAFYAKNANMWRITDDFWDSWELLRNTFLRCEMWQDHVKPGCFPDADMLVLGKVGAGFGEERDTCFTFDEQKTMMVLWCMFGSPLMIGAELTKLDEKTLKLLTDRSYLKFLDGHHKGEQILRTTKEVIWKCTNLDTGKISVALFNLLDEERIVSVDSKEVSDDGRADCFAEKDGRTIQALVPAHGVVLKTDEIEY